MNSIIFLFLILLFIFLIKNLTDSLDLSVSNYFYLLNFLLEEGFYNKIFNLF